METTFDLPEDLLAEAAAVAADRHTTLETLIEQALRREIGVSTPTSDADDFIEIGPHGFPRLKRRGEAFITTEMIRRMMEDDAA